MKEKLQSSAANHNTAMLQILFIRPSTLQRSAEEQKQMKEKKQKQVWGLLEKSHAQGQKDSSWN